jgi:hypothetical protein
MGFVRTVAELTDLLLGNEKTKIINLIVCCRDGRLRAYLIPRWTRLPVNYVEHFGDPDKTIKPGHSDMSGSIITVDRDIYEFSTAEQIAEALSYVSSSREDLAFFYDHLSGGIRDAEEHFEVKFGDLPEQVDGLWRRGIDAGFVREECLHGLESKTYMGGLIVVQLNATRKAVVSDERVEKRKKGDEECPYCIEEEGREDMPWNGYVISANPYPYSDHHVIIANAEHIYQYVDADALRIAVDFVTSAPEYTVGYNGPPGTTILGHMHFQAAIRALPAEKAGVKVLASDGDLSVGELEGFPSRIFVVEKVVDVHESGN